MPSVSTAMGLHAVAGPGPGTNNSSFPMTSWHPLSRQPPPIDSRQQRYITSGTFLFQAKPASFSPLLSKVGSFKPAQGLGSAVSSPERIPGGKRTLLAGAFLHLKNCMW